MNTNETNPDRPAGPEQIGDQNVERLLGKAYRPEVPEPEFVRRVEGLLLSAACERASRRETPDLRETIASRPAFRRVRLFWSAVAATLLIGAGFVAGRFLGRHGSDRDEPPIEHIASTDQPDGRTLNYVQSSRPYSAANDLANRTADNSHALVGNRGLTPRPRPAGPPLDAIAVEDSLETAAGQRRRVALPDGSALYLNQNTRVTVTAHRRVTLAAGEIFVEVSPRSPDDDAESAPFVVQTPSREITALGTKFAVRADSGETGVVVTQGKVRVSDLDQPIVAGQQFVTTKDLADKAASRIAAAPRVSHVLDWTRDLVAAAESPLVPASAHAGGALVAVDPSGQEAKLSLQKFHVDVYIEDGFARTTIDQTYFNHTSWRLEGTFHFPLPPDASLSRLAMYVEGKLMEGGMAERNYAREVFEKIVRTQKDPALLEWVDGSTFKMRVFPLEARQEKRIVLSYTQRLDTLYGNSKYRFPAGHSLDAVHDWSFHARVKRGAEVTWSCDSHELKQSKDAGDLVLDAEAKEVKLDRDVVLRLTDRSHEFPRPLTPNPSPPKRGEGSPSSEPNEERSPSSPLSPSAGRGAGGEGSVRFSSTSHDGQRYLMLRFHPELPTKAQRQRRDWVFLFESSGDRDPVLARVQVDVVKGLLQNAEHDDTFAILTAATQVRAFANEPRPATPENVKQAIEFLDGVHLVGALDLGQALAAAEPFVKSGKNAYLVHVGSGMPVLGERSEDKLLKRIPAGARYVGVGVGKRWSRQFMKTAASRTGGYFTQINPDEPVAWRAFDLYSTLNTPRLLNASVVDHAERATFLVYNDSIVHGEELCAIARLADGNSLPEKITVSGTLDGEPFRRVIPVENVAPNADYLPRTWAKLRIDQLLADDAAKHKDEIISLSKAMYVMSPFTSLLVLETDQMYLQFQIDRGRKDHWAMYRCPEQIPVVYEPLPSSAAVAKAASQPDTAAKKPSVPEVLGTIVIRAPSRAKLRFRLPNSGTWASESDLGSLDVQRLVEQTIGQLVVDTNNPNSALRGHSLLQDVHSYNDDSFRWHYFRNEGRDEDYDYADRNNMFLGGFRGDGTALVPSLGYFQPNLSLVVNQSRADDFEYRLPELGVFMAETSANWYELLELREARRHRQLLTVLQIDKSHIPFPNEPPVEYPDATWWQEMSRRRKLWSRVDLRFPSAAEYEIGNKLRQPVTLEFVETPLSDVVDFLRDSTRLNIVLDKPALEDEGLTSDTPVSIHVQSVALKYALKILLGRHRLTYLVKDDVLQVTSQLEAASELGRRVYPVHDLVIPLNGNLNLNVHGNVSFDTLGIEPWDVGWTFYHKLGKSDESRGLRQLYERDINLQNAFSPSLFASADDFLDTSALRRSQANLRRTQLFLDNYRVKDVRDGTSLRFSMGEVAGGESIIGTSWGNPHPLFAAFHMSDDFVDASTGLTYQRPVFSGDTRVFSDLIAYAPGMGASRADVLAVLESEAEPQRTRPGGDIEPLARAIIDKARGAGWQSLTLPAGEGRTPLKIAFDGSGRFGFDRTTEEGLRERVVCDATTLWHLYPELGIGAKRNVSRFHRAEFLSLVPWLLPSVEDLARDADLLAINERTVAIVPRGAKPAPPRVASGQNEKDEEAQPKLTHFWSIHLIFAEDGRLAERRLVAMPAGKVLARETYTADGTVKLLDLDDKVLAENKLSVEPAGQPDLTPNTKDLVVLSMPVRTSEHVFETSKRPRDGRFDQWSEEDALKLLAADLTQNPNEVMQIVGQRFFAKGDRRIGFYTLLMASGATWDPESERAMSDGTQVRFDPVADHPDALLAKYVFLHQQQMSKSGKIEQMDLADQRIDGFLNRLADFRDVYARLTSGKASQGTVEQRAADRQKAVEFVRRCKSPLFGWTVLSMLLDEAGGDPESYRSLADACRLFEKVPGLSYSARYEAARCSLQAGDWQKARDQFRELHTAALKLDVLPPIDASFTQAFRYDGEGSTQLAALMRGAGEKLIERGDRRAAFALAWQCHHVGESQLAEDVFTAALSELPDDTRFGTTLAAVHYLWQTGQYARADALFQPLLADEQLKQDSAFWRIGAALAEHNGMTTRSVMCLDEAMDLEYQRLPDEVNLESVRQVYGQLLGRFQQLADAIDTLPAEPPQELISRVVRATDRWRSLDTDDTAACQVAARVLQRLGAHDLAWDYLTTPLGDRPGDSPAWLDIAQTFRGHSEFELADRSYAKALLAEPTNAQILWDHAQMLEQAGRFNDARSLIRQLGEGQWPQQYESLQTRAQSQLKKLDNPANPEKP